MPDTGDIVRDGVEIGQDGRCKCSCATPCPIGRSGSAERCSKAKLEGLGIKTWTGFKREFKFSPGQTVYCKDTGTPYEFIASKYEKAFVFNAESEIAFLTDMAGLVAVDPSVADDAALTEDWLRKAGLYEGDLRLTARGEGEQRLAYIVNYGPDNKCEWSYHAAFCKTVGDARTLLRLLGVR